MPKHTLAKLQAEIEEVYLVKDPHITKVMAASVVAHFLSSDPTWIVILAPSGGCKSEFVNLINSMAWTPPATDARPYSEEQKVYALSTLTSKTFISGQKAVGKDTSLLMQISSGIITFKDLTSLLSEQKDERAIIMAQLREIYDGKLAKSFGTGETIEWKGKITILAASTYAIHSMQQSYKAMGERFIFYNMEQPGRYEAAERTMENQEEGRMTEHRDRLAGKMREYCLDVLNNMPKEPTKITASQRKDTLDLAELATRARSDVQRNWSSREQEITEVYPPEMPTRFAGQLQTMMGALQILNLHDAGKPEMMPEDEKIIAKLALDSVTRSRRTAMIELSKYDILETAGLAVKLGMPTSSIRRWVEDLVALEVAEREKGSGSKGDRWKIKPQYRDIIMRYEGVKKEAGELTELGAEAEELKAAALEQGSFIPPFDEDENRRIAREAGVEDLLG